MSFSNKPIKLSILLFTSLFYALLGGYSCSSPPPSEEQKITSKMDQIKDELLNIKQQKLELILDRLYDKGLFNGVVLIASEGQVIIQKSYGWADFRAERPLEMQSAFRIGAITETFTATALLKLVQQESLSLEDSIQKFIPDFPYPPISIHQLLSHTSGLPDYLDHFYLDAPKRLDYARNLNILDWLKQDQPPLTFLPGLEWGYSNTNYVLLAEIIEEVSQMPLADFLNQIIFQPLEMQQTSLPGFQNDPDIPQRVYGFHPDNTELYDDNFLNKIYGDRGLYSSAEDLYRWDQSLYTEEILPESLWQKAFNPVVLANGQSYPYGYGWHIKEEGKTVYHYGSWLGFGAALLRSPQQKDTIILLSNNQNAIMQEIVEMIYNILNHRPYQIPN